MERLINLLPKVIFLSYIVKMIAFTPTSTDVGVIAALAGIAALQIYTEKKQTIQDIKTDCQKQLDEIKEVVNKQINVINLQAIEFTKLRQDMSGLKLKENFKSIEGFGGIKKAS